MKQIFLSLVCLISMLLTSATLYAVDYDVWVGGTRVTSANANDVLGDGGTVKWDDANNKLTLRNANIDAGNTGNVGIRFGGVYTFANKCITIVYLGTNTITSNNDRCISVYSNDVRLYITNNGTSGKLTLTGKYGIYAGRLSTGEASVCIDQGSYSGFIKINTQYYSVNTDNLIFSNLAGSNNNFKTTSTATDEDCIICKSMYIGSSLSGTFDDTFNSRSYSHNLTIDGAVKIRYHKFDLNKQTTASNYIKTPTSAAIGKDGYVYDVKTGNKATKVVISNGVTRHNIWVKGVEVTSNNASDILGDGKVSYNASNNTLTLNGLQILMDDQFAYYGRPHNGQVAYIYYGEKAAANRKIELQGINYVDMRINGTRPCFIITDAENNNGADIAFTGTGGMSMYLNNDSTASNVDYMLLSGNQYAKFIFQGSGKIWASTFNSSKDKFANDSVIVRSTKYQTYWDSNPHVTDELQCSNVVTTDFKAARDASIRTIHMIPAYELYLADVRVDEVNKDDIAARSSNISGTVSFNPTTKTLSMSNATITYNGNKTYNTRSAIYNFGDLVNLNIALSGTNNMNLTASNSYPIGATFNNATLKGTGNLNINVTNNNASGSAYGIFGNLGVQGSGTITITTPNAGSNMAVFGDITAASGYLMYSGATAATATLKYPIPTTCSDHYVRLTYNTAGALTFTDNAAMDIPASVVGVAIPNINCKTYVSGGVQPYTFSATGLPAGITINASTGVISGTPTAVKAAGNATITVKDAINTTKSVTIAYGAVAAALTFTDNAAMDIPASVVGVAIPNINCKTYVSGGKQPYTFSATGLPAGITINASTGVISGTPTAVKASGNATITVKDANNTTKSVTIAYGAVAAALTFTDNAAMDIPASVVGTAIANINCMTFVSGGTTPYTFSAFNLPAGITIVPSTGIISGTPTTAQPAGQSIITVTDANNIQKQVTINFGAVTAALTFTSNSAMNIPASTIGVAITAINCAPYVSGGTTPYTFSATGLPAGITINASTGIISGTPTTAQPAGQSIITVTDANNIQKQVTINFGAVTAALTFTSNSAMNIPASTIGVAITAINCAPYVSGGTTPYTFSATGLPAGITIAPSTGVISGIPTTATTAGTATIIVTDANNITESVTIAYGAVTAALTFTDSAAMDIPASVVGTAIANINCMTFVSGGTTPYTFSAFNLPAGITIAPSTGIISGTPTTAQPAGQSIITVTDANNIQKQVTINFGAVTAALTFTSSSAMNIPASTIGVAITAISCAPYVSGGTTPYTFSAFNLPAGITIVPSTGIISGTPTTAQPAGQSIITVTDANNIQKQVTINFGAVTAALTFTDNSAMDILASVVGTAITNINCMTFVSGGTTPYTFSAFNLPAGITINSSTGIISGTPSAVQPAGQSIITVTDANNIQKQVTINFGAVTAALTFTSNSAMNIPASTIGVAITAINCAPYVSGGTTPYTFSATGLPAGISITPSTGVISGIPTTATPVGIATITVTDANNSSESVIIAYGAVTTPIAPLVFTDNSAMDIPASVVGTAIANINCMTFVSGGTTPYTFSATGLPAGITINASTGVISGTPTAATTAGTATITVTDANNSSESVTIAYGAVTTPIAPLVFTDNSAMDIPASVVGTAIANINCMTFVSGGTTPYTFSATGLPAGISITPSTGIISGTPTAATPVGTATITVTDANNSSESVTIAYGAVTTPIAPLVFTDNSAMDIPASVVGTAIANINCMTFVSGGTTPYTFSATGLPAGITIDAATGIISGTPTAATTAGTATITVTDANNSSESVTIAYGAVTTPIAPLVFTDNAAMDIPASVVGTAIANINCMTFVSGGTTPYTFSATGLPAGITIDAATGIISGTPTAATAAGTATVTVTDADGTSQSVTIAYGEITEEVVAIDNINNDELIVWSRDGFIGSSADEYTIYSINGTDVTAQNGNLLRGSYIVRSAHGVAKITIK